MRQVSKLLAGFVAVGATAFTLVGATAASAASSTVYVSKHGRGGNSDRSCATARYRHINEAIAAAPKGGTVIVCGGTYRVQAVVTKQLALIGRHGATINARGQKPISKKLPGGSGVVVYRTRNVEVSGFTVENAGFDAILVARSSRVLVSHNLLEHNGDVGVDFNGTSDSLATHNLSEFNKGGGFLIADDLGPTHYNAVTRNAALHNPGGCGVIIAGHSTSGVWGNYVAHNLLAWNGLNKKEPGAGVVIATEVKGERVSDNLVADNNIYGNGLSGVTIHSHVPGQRMSGNQIVGNDIGRNNLVGDTIGLAPPVTAHPDKRTTGILVGASSSIKVWIHGNYIHNNWFGIYLNGRIRAHIHNNRFHRVHKPVKVA
ncbi:MAG TPA: right-handed parallel beta-helix repeat-containing protein [Streptosporangiaceae bacterium]